MPTYCLGDIQGCYQELLLLLNKIQFNPNHDSLWLTGDLVNRGPQSLEVLRFIKSLGGRAKIVLGNHDLHLLARALAKNPGKKSDTLDLLLKAADCEELCQWLRQQPLIHFDKDLNFVMVHAGIPPIWTLSDALKYAGEVEAELKSENYVSLLQNMYGVDPDQWNDHLTGITRWRLIINYLTRMRFCTPDGRIELSSTGDSNSAPTGYFPWFKLKNQLSNYKVVFGHWAAIDGITHEPNIFALDTGCVWGRCLTAMRLEDQQRFSVKCGS